MTTSLEPIARTAEPDSMSRAEGISVTVVQVSVLRSYFSAVAITRINPRGDGWCPPTANRLLPTIAAPWSSRSVGIFRSDVHASVAPMYERCTAVLQQV